MLEPTIELERHPLSAMFPEITGDKFEELVKSVEETGNREEVVLYQGKVLDGWNRYRACKQAKRAIKAREFDPSREGAVEQFVKDMNLMRRDLTPAQRAVIGAKLMEMYREEAQGRKKAGKKATGKKGSARQQAAEAANVSEAYIAFAAEVEEAYPDIAAKLRAGEVTIPEAKRMIKELEAEPEEVRDKLGNVIDDVEIKEVFLEAEDVRTALKRAGALTREIKAKQDSATGSAALVDLAAVRRAMKTAKGYVNAGLPYCLVPKEYEGKEGKKRGWLSEEEYNKFANITETEEGEEGEAEAPPKKLAKRTKATKKPAAKK